jgi:hypothetical protein
VEHFSGSKGLIWDSRIPEEELAPKEGVKEQTTLYKKTYYRSVKHQFQFLLYD